MSKARVAVLKVVRNELTVTAAAHQYGYSRRHLHRLLTRYHHGGIDAVDPGSGRPHTNSDTATTDIRELIIELRLQLTKDGLDAGLVTIAWHLTDNGHQSPSTSTIRRILHTAGLITPEPRKRPRTSYRRFEASQPNECRQSDTTRWRLVDGTDTEILNWPAQATTPASSSAPPSTPRSPPTSWSSTSWPPATNTVRPPPP